MLKNQNCTKWVFFLIGFTLITVLLFSYRDEIREIFTHEKVEEQKREIKSKEQKNQELNKQVESLDEQVVHLKNKLSEVMNPSNDSEEQERKNETFLTNFAENWTNFSSIEERNQSVKDFLSEKAIHDNGIDAKLNVEFVSKGEVKKIAKVSDEKQDKYMVLVDEKARDEANTMLIEATIKQNQVEDFNARYVDSEFEE